VIVPLFPQFIFIYREGEEWAALRKPAQEKMLRPANVASYVPLISRVTNDFVEVLRKKGKIDDLQKELMNYSTESKSNVEKYGLLSSIINVDIKYISLYTTGARGLGLWCVMRLSTIYQFYGGSQFY